MGPQTRGQKLPYPLGDPKESLCVLKLVKKMQPMPDGEADDFIWPQTDTVEQKVGISFKVPSPEQILFIKFDRRCHLGLMRSLYEFLI